MAPESFLYVGVGITDYLHFDRLPRAVPDVRELGTVLEARGYKVQKRENPSDNEARTFLKDAFDTAHCPEGSSLVVLWAGHGEPTPGSSLHLIAADSAPNTTPEVTPEFLSDLIARSGARQVLVLLDTCYSGGGVFELARAFDLIRREQAGESGWLGVVASALDFERAKDGAFIRQVLRLLREGPSNPALRTRWSAHNEGIRGDDVIDALLKEWGDLGQKPKQLATGSAWPMFPNPRYDADAPESVVEHLLLAAHGRAPDEEGIFFTGRTAQLEQLVSWMRDDRPGVFLVTGPAGCGKSALAGRIVTLSNPAQRAAILSEGPLDHADPGEGSVSAHVHARGLTADQTAARIDRQLVNRSVLVATGQPRTRVDLVRDLQQTSATPVIVLDGIDESGSEAWGLARELIAPLSSSAKLVVTTRDLPPRQEGDASLAQSFGASDVIDFARPELGVATRDDVRAYVHRRLADANPMTMNVRAVADAVVRQVASGNEGPFLLARVITSRLRAEPVDTSLPGWESALSTSVADAFDRDVDRSSDPVRLRELLTGLAWAYGSGVPDDVWPTIAAALSASGTKHTREDVHWALSQAGRYIIEDGEGGRAVYRLAHQKLVELLNPRAEFSIDIHEELAARVSRAIVDQYLGLVAGGLDPASHVYLWRYAWRHCSDGGGRGIAALRTLVQARSVDFLPHLAHALTSVGVSYNRVGRLQEAVASTEEAVTSYRALAASDPTFLPDLGRALTNLGAWYSGVRRQADAVASTEEAVATFRTLFANDPVFLPDLAPALHNLGVQYGEVGRPQDALTPTEESVRLRRALAADNPAFLPDLASALYDLGVRYSEAERREDAIAPTEESVRLRRVLAADNRFLLPALASALHNLGVRYSEVGRLEDAVQPTEEAVSLRRTLAADEPAFLPELANSLHNLGSFYGAAGRLEDAVAPIEEAVRLGHTLAADSPTFLHGLASTLHTLGSLYCALGRVKDAVAPTEEAVRLRRTLARDNPALLADLSSTLNNLGVVYSGVGRRQDAVAPTEEAVASLRAVAADNPTLLPTLAGALNNLGMRYSEIGRHLDAVAPTEQAVHLWRTLCVANTSFLTGLAGALGSLSSRYADVSRGSDAEMAAAEAQGILQSLT